MPTNQQQGSINNLVVPHTTAALQQMKYEIAQGLGILLAQDSYYSNYTSP